MTVSISLRPASCDSDVVAGLRLLFRQEWGSQAALSSARILETAAADQLDLRHLWLAEAQNGNHHTAQVVGAVLVICQSDDSATLIPPACQTGLQDSRHCLKILIELAVTIARQQGARSVQALLPDQPDERHGLLQAHGVPLIGPLDFMVHPGTAVAPLDRLAEVQTGIESAEFELEPIGAAHAAAEFARLVAQTYEDSADFPELLSRKQSADCLATHRLQGRFDPNFWFRIHVGNEPCGAILFTFHPSHQRWELIYLGILPKFRRRRLARYAIQSAMSNEQIGRGPIFLGVDARNLAAVRLYRSVGFLISGRQRVHFCWLDADRS